MHSHKHAGSCQQKILSSVLSAFVFWKQVFKGAGLQLYFHVLSELIIQFVCSTRFLCINNCHLMFAKNFGLGCDLR